MDKETFNKCIQTGSLHFNDPWRKFTHYSIVGFFLITPCLLLIFHLFDFNLKFRRDEVLISVISIFLSGILYLIQKNRLKFDIVKTNLTREDLNKIILRVAEELEWIRIASNSKSYEAKTSASFFSGSWGEHITVLFHSNSVLINSICDPDKKSSLVSFRRNHKNTQTLKKKILDANNITPSAV